MTDWTSRRFPVLEVLEVYDGDTYRLLIDVGFEHAAYPWLRLHRWSCPEMGERGGPAARDAAFGLLMQAANEGTLEVTTHRTRAPIVLRRYRDERRTLTRYLADVWLDGANRHLGSALEALEHARPGSRVG